MSEYTSRARFVPVEKGFNIKRPPIEPQAFVAEKERAFAADMPTGLIPLDLSATLGTDYPATTPFMLTRYVRVRAGETGMQFCSQRRDVGRPARQRGAEARKRAAGLEHGRHARAARGRRVRLGGP
jgi:hypothetical protein